MFEWLSIDDPKYFDDHIAARSSRIIPRENAKDFVQFYKARVCGSGTDLKSDIKADIVIKNTERRRITILDLHTYKAFISLKRALELKFFRLPIYSVYVYTPLEEIAKRVKRRNLEAVSGETLYYNLRFSSHPFTEFFDNLEKTCEKKESICTIYKRQIYDIVPRLTLESMTELAEILMKKYPKLSGNLQYKAESIVSDIRRAINDFFGNRNEVATTFKGSSNLIVVNHSSALEIMPKIASLTIPSA
jgi:hypothetical protein